LLNTILGFNLLHIVPNLRKDLTLQILTYIVDKILRASAIQPATEGILAFPVKIVTENLDLVLVIHRTGTPPKSTHPDKTPQGHKIVHIVQTGTREQNNRVIKIIDQAIRRIVMNALIVQKGTNAPQIEIVPTVEIETRLGAETTEIKNGIVTALTAETDIPIIIKEEVVSLVMTEIGIRTWKDSGISNRSMIVTNEINFETENEIDHEKFIIVQTQINHLTDPRHLTR
jgi:hypothetical protein